MAPPETPPALPRGVPPPFTPLALDEKETRILERISDGFVALDYQWRYLYLNPQVELILGRRREELLGRRIWDILPAAVGTVFQEKLTRAMTERAGVEFEALFAPANRWYSIRARPTTYGLEVFSTNITERKRSEEAKREFVSLVERSEEIIAAMDLDGRFHFINDTGRTLFGLDPRDDARETRLEDCFTPPDRARARDEILPALLAHGYWKGELTIQNRRTGACRPVFWSGFAIHDPETGQPTALACVAGDLSARRNAETALRGTHENLRQLFDSAPFAILELDLEGRVQSWNAGAERMFGWTLAETLGQLCPAVLPERLPGFRDLICRVMQAGPQAGLLEPQRTKAGDPIETRLCATPLKDAAGRVTGVLLMLEDVGERRRAEAALREAEAKYRELFQLADEIILFLDADGRITDVNRKLEGVTGYRPDEVIGQAITTKLVIGADRAMFRWVIGQAQRGVESRYEVRWLTRDGKVVYLDGTAIPRFSPDGQFIATHCVVRDVTERRRARVKLEEYAERLKALSAKLVETQEAERRDVARELHDEVGQWLTMLRLGVDTCLKLPPEAVGPKLRQVQADVDLLLGKVRQLSLQLRPTILDDLGLLPALLAHFDHYAAQAGLLVGFKHEGVERRRFDVKIETAAYRTIQEALTNAVRHSGVTEIAVTLWADASLLQLQVEDQGRGFDLPAALAAHASSGLCGMYERAELVGGQLTIHTRPGAGARITLELPLGKALTPINLKHD